MSKRYERATDDAVRKIAALRKEYYDVEPGFELVTVGALFVFDPDHPDVPTLTLRGYPAAAIARIVGLRDRAVGLPDAQIVIDRATWVTLTAKQHNALLDHELHHLELALDKKGKVRFDTQGRPKLRIRKHDWEFGWFNEIAQRHGADSIERMQAKLIVSTTGQLYFDFMQAAA